MRAKDVTIVWNALNVYPASHVSHVLMTHQMKFVTPRNVKDAKMKDANHVLNARNVSNAYLIDYLCFPH